MFANSKRPQKARVASLFVPAREQIDRDSMHESDQIVI